MGLVKRRESKTGEATGIVPSPTKGFGLNVQYATSSFGQGTTQTMLQMAAAYASVVNGGNYYQPRLSISLPVKTKQVKKILKS